MNTTASSDGVPSNDYWDNEFDPGTSSTWHFDGAEGLTRLDGPFAYSAGAAASFRARLTRVQLDHVAVEAFEATAHTAERSAARVDAFPTPLLTFAAVVEGHARVALATTAFDLGPGQCLVIDSRDTITWDVDHEIRLLQATVGIEHVPLLLRARGATIPAPLRQTMLVTSFITFIASILRTTATGRRARGEHLIQAVADLQTAVLAEAQQLHALEPGLIGLRYQMEQYIDASYRDPDLDPAAIAAVFDISVRHAHDVFNDGERTIARFIRDRRLAAAALLLRTEHQTGSMSLTARQVGFRNLDTFTNAFTHRFGMSPIDYRNGGHRHLG